MSEELQVQTELPEQQDAEFPVKQTLVAKIKGWRSGLGARWAQLHTNQVIYVVALFLFFVVDHDFKSISNSIWFVGVLAFVGMARELWAIFVKVWESTFGRLVLLVVYAAIANFTIAVAAQKVNLVIGADPTQLYHTLGVTTLLVLPLWLMVVSIVAMIVIFGLMQLRHLVTGLFVLMRIIGKNTKPKEAFPKTFIIVRLILLVPVSMAMFSSLEWYGQQLNLHNVPGVSFSENSGGIVDEQVAKVGLGIIEAELQKENLSDQQYKDLMTAKQKLQENFDYNTNQSLTESTSIPKDELVNNEESKENEAGSEQTNKEAIEIFFLDGVIASFVYHYEAFEYSHCQKEAGERVVYISENDILIAKKDENAPTGYAFSTSSCIVAN